MSDQPKDELFAEIVGEAFDESIGCENAPDGMLFCYWPVPHPEPCRECLKLKAAINQYAEVQLTALRSDHARLIATLQALQAEWQAAADRRGRGQTTGLPPWRVLENCAGILRDVIAAASSGRTA